MDFDYDLLIIGGGLVGGSLALALSDTRLRIAIVEAQTETERAESPAGNRALALARGSRQILDELGVWEHVGKQAAPIRHIHVSDRGHFGKARLHAADRGVDALGFVATARALESAIDQRLNDTSIDRLCPARVTGLKGGPAGVCVTLNREGHYLNLNARLVVAADGGNSTVRTLLGIEQIARDYGQTAIVTEVRTERDSGDTAYERFTDSGPLAFLPLGRKNCSVVWTLKNEAAQDILDTSEAEFTAALQIAFGYWLGAIRLVAPRLAFPLKLIQAGRMTQERVVLIGNAMHQLHPVAGQGFNLGLRDAELLAERLKTQLAFGGDIGAEGFLNAYASARQRDLGRVVRFTDSLVQIFSNDSLPLAVARNAALLILDRLPAAKRLLVSQAMGYGPRA